MMRRLLACFAIAVTVGLAACQTQTLNFEAGLNAAESGNYAAAAEIWRPLAENGDMLAQYRLAGLYAEGSGVERDPAEEHDLAEEDPGRTAAMRQRLVEALATHQAAATQPSQQPIDGLTRRRLQALGYSEPVSESEELDATPQHDAR